MSPAPFSPPRGSLQRRRTRAAVSFAWLLTSIAIASLAAGCGPSWPTVRAVYHPEFKSHTGLVATVDLLPGDIDVAVDPELPISLHETAEFINETVMATAARELTKRGYRVAKLDWDGQFVAADASGRAMEAPVLVATANTLRTYGDKQQDAVLIGKPWSMDPKLPSGLGDATGSDTTLYVGGRAFAGRSPRRSSVDAETIVMVAFVAVFAIAVIAIVVSAGGDGSSLLSGGKKRRKRSGKRSRRRGRLPVATRATRDHRSRASGRVGSGPLADVSAGTRTRASSRRSRGRSARGGRVLADVYVNAEQFAPDIGDLPSAPPRRPRDIEARERSWIELEMTLVSNETGLVQWHARQRFDISPRRRDHLRSAVRRMVKTIPRRPTQGRSAALATR